MSLSVRAYARHRKSSGITGGTPKAVREAISSGRLFKSVTRDGKIRSAALADAEWAATTLEDRIPLSGPAAAPAAAAGSSGALLEARVHREGLRSRRDVLAIEQAEIDLAVRKGELVLAAGIEARLVAVFSNCRSKVLGAASRIAQRDPSLTAKQIVLIDEVLRETLEDLAVGNVETTP